MCWIGFGEYINATDLFSKKIVNKPEYSLHLQCPWRIVYGKEIVIASYDMYEPNSSISDEKVVSSVYLTDRNDLFIEFSNGYALECFINTSTDSECWRFFKYHSKHLVVSGNGLEWQ